MALSSPSSSFSKPSADLFQPAQCYSPHHIIAFLRQSRRLSDDKLYTFGSKSDSCGEFISSVLYPSWHARDQLLTYCQSVAEHNSSYNKADQNQDSQLYGNDNSTDNTDNTDKTAPLDNSRLDPYTSKDYHRGNSEPEQDIMAWVNNEQNVESIVRSSSAEALAEKCAILSRDPAFYLHAYNVSSEGRGV